MAGEDPPLLRTRLYYCLAVARVKKKLSFFVIIYYTIRELDLCPGTLTFGFPSCRDR